MKLIVGLGNPGVRYNFTRHNTGFLVLDYFFKKNKLSWNDKPRFGAIWYKSEDIIYIKPQEFYNESGKVVVAFKNYYKILPTDIMVICDDFNLEFGKIRYRNSGSAGGNNGLKSIITALNTDEFKRLRIGTGNDELRKKLGDIDFVLSKYTPAEREKLPEVLTEAVEKFYHEIN